MANNEDLARIWQGVAAWNAWRDEHRFSSPDFSGANLNRADLREANFTRADLYRADLRGASLPGADLNRAKLTRADLAGADLSGSNLAVADLSETDLSEANLNRADLREANFTRADLSGADLREAILEGATLSRATLRADRGGGLSGADLAGAKLFETVFANVDLSATKGLEHCTHHGYRTLQRSGRLPLAFLRGCGLSDWQIEAAKLNQPGLTSEQITDIVYRIHDLRSTRPIQIHNLFISYSHADSVFLEHIEKHLNKRGIRFWRDIHDAPAGPLEQIVVRAIRHNPTVLLVLSDNSVRSDWVEYEAQTARELEKEMGRHVLCPLALNKSWLSCKWSAVLRNQIKKYNVLDFSDWQNAPAFESKFRRLLSGIHLFYGDEGNSSQMADEWKL